MPNRDAPPQFLLYRDGPTAWRWSLYGAGARRLADSAVQYPSKLHALQAIHLLGALAGNAGIWNDAEQAWERPSQQMDAVAGGTHGWTQQEGRDDTGAGAAVAM